MNKSFYFFKLAIEIGGSALKSRVGRVSGNTGIFLGIRPTSREEFDSSKYGPEIQRTDMPPALSLYCVLSYTFSYKLKRAFYIVFTNFQTFISVTSEFFFIIYASFIK